MAQLKGSWTPAHLCICLYTTDYDSKIVYQKFTFGGNVPAQLFAVDVATGQTTMLDEVTPEGLYLNFAADQKGAIYYASKGMVIYKSIMSPLMAAC